jgi:hypothetical protein
MMVVQNGGPANTPLALLSRIEALVVTVANRRSKIQKRYCRAPSSPAPQMGLSFFLDNPITRRIV